MRRRFHMFLPEQHAGGCPLLPDDPGQAGGDSQGGAAGGDTGGGQQGGGAPGGTGDADGQQDGQGESHWRAHAKTWEQRAKADRTRAEQLEQQVAELRRSQMSDGEKAIADAREEGRKAALAEAAGQVAEANLRAALTGRVSPQQMDALLQVVDRGRFVKDGAPDTAAITAWADQVAPKGAGAGFPDLGQGRRTASPTTDMDTLIRRAAGVTSG